jgi:type I restriction enzyme S subunit
MNIARKQQWIIRAGDVVYNKLFAWKGAFAIADDSVDGCIVSDKFPTYEANAALVDPRLLAWYFRTPELAKQAEGLSKGAAAISKLTLNPPQFWDLTLPLPPLDEQRRIVARIEELAAKIEEACTLQGHAGKESGAVIRAVLRGILDGIQRDGQLGRVLSTAPRNGWSASCDNAEGGTPVLSLSAVTGFRYRATEFKRTSLSTPKAGHIWLERGDLLITRSNTPELVGHAAIYDGSPTPCIYPDLMMRLDLRREAVDPRFVWYWLQAPQTRDFIRTNSKGTSPTMKKISQSTVMAIPFPSSVALPEQRRIVAELDALQAKVDELKRLQAETAAELDALLPSILDKAFKGAL